MLIYIRDEQFPLNGSSERLRPYKDKQASVYFSVYSLLVMTWSVL